MMLPRAFLLVLVAFETSGFAPLTQDATSMTRRAANPTAATAAAATATVSVAKASLLSLLSERTDPVLVCPTSLEPLTQKTDFIGVPRETWRCARFGTAYGRMGQYLDLTPKDDSKPLWEKQLQEIVQTDTFRNPLVAFLYERGWRQGFKNAGFPGVDDEFEQLLKFWGESEGSPSVLGGTLLDLSCGSGLMARRIAKHGTARRLFAGDYSEAMLRETARRFAAEEGLTRPELRRLDAARLPFAAGTLAGVHAGAALHCWPRLDEALREVHRVLVPGGKFFATTFKVGAYGLNKEANSPGGASFRFFEVDELKGLLAAAGFTQVDVKLVGQGCLIARCVK
jgi:SAM-dependent methyltransferase